MSILYVNNIEPVSGSSLTLISASLVSVDNLTVTSLTSSFQGNLQGTASFANTASFALNATPPAGINGQIQFNSGSNFGADSNLFWDNTNKRLGVGTNTPSGKFQINDSSTSLELNVNNTFLFAELKTNRTLISFGANGVNALRVFDTGTQIGVPSGSPTARLHVRGSGSTSATTALLVQNTNTSASLAVLDNSSVGIGISNPSASLHVRSSGSTSASTALLVQNSSASNIISVTDDRVVTINNQISVTHTSFGQWLNVNNTSNQLCIMGYANGAADHIFQTAANFNNSNFRQNAGGFGFQVGALPTIDASAILDITSTTKGFLPPRTNLTSNISAPAQGLITYLTGSTNEGLYYYNSGSYQAWTKIINNSGSQAISGNLTVTGSATNSLLVRGSGTTAATTALLVQNSAGTAALSVSDNGNVELGTSTSTVAFNLGFNNTFTQNRLSFYQASTNIRGINAGGQGLIISKTSGITDLYPTALLAIDSTTQGFLPPRTNLTSNISAPAQGLITYLTGSTNEGLYYYNSGSYQAWTKVINNSGSQEIAGNLTITGSATNSLLVRGSGTTAATTSLLVQNSSGTQALKVDDGGGLQIGLTSTINWTFSSNTLASSQYAFISSNNGSILSTGANNGGVFGNNNGGKVADSGIANPQVASAVLEVSSTTRGFLPPRTNLTSNISAPAQGLITYLTGSTNEGLYYYNSGSIRSWTKLLNDTGSQSITGSLSISGSATISNILTLTPQSPLPSGVPTSSFAVSSSVPPKPYFWDGSSWNALY